MIHDTTMLPCDHVWLNLNLSGNFGGTSSNSTPGKPDATGLENIPEESSFGKKCQQLR